MSLGCTLPDGLLTRLRGTYDGQLQYNEAEEQMKKALEWQPGRMASRTVCRTTSARMIDGDVTTRETYETRLEHDEARKQMKKALGQLDNGMPCDFRVND